MHERHRAEYLQALGVPSYMPRFVLPLAPAPRQAQLPPAAAPDKPVPSHSVAQLVSAESIPDHSGSSPLPPSALGETSPADTSALQAAVAGVASEVSIARNAPSPTAVAAPPQQVSPFVLSCWWLGEELLAVDSREPGIALPVESLFKNIVRALGWDQLTGESERLQWPLAENPFAAAAGATDARDTCSVWLEAASARRPVKAIWLMGAAAREYCAPISLATPLVEGSESDWNGIRIIAMPSLSDLLQEPARKRELWALLQRAYPQQTRRQ